MIPPKHLIHKLHKSASNQEVYMESNHICLSGEVMGKMGKDIQNVFLVFQPETSTLLLSPVSNTFFPKLYSATQHLLKDKNLQGTKSLAIHELLIDHEVPNQNRELQYEVLNKHKLLKIYL